MVYAMTRTLLHRAHHRRAAQPGRGAQPGAVLRRHRACPPSSAPCSTPTSRRPTASTRSRPGPPSCGLAEWVFSIGAIVLGLLCIGGRVLLRRRRKRLDHRTRSTRTTWSTPDGRLSPARSRSRSSSSSNPGRSQWPARARRVSVVRRAGRPRRGTVRCRRRSPGGTPARSRRRRVTWPRWETSSVEPSRRASSRMPPAISLAVAGRPPVGAASSGAVAQPVLDLVRARVLEVAEPEQGAAVGDPVVVGRRGSGRAPTATARCRVPRPAASLCRRTPARPRSPPRRCATSRARSSSANASPLPTRSCRARRPPRAAGTPPPPAVGSRSARRPPRVGSVADPAGRRTRPAVPRRAQRVRRAARARRPRRDGRR